MAHKNIGSNFDDFLEDEKILEHSEEVAAKRVVAFQLQEEMKRQKVTTSILAERMDTSRSSVRRLLDPNNDSMTVKTLKRAARSLGKRVEIRLV